MSVVLFGGGSSLVVEVEESCARLGLDVIAIVRNVDDRVHALARDRIVPAEEVGPALAAHPYLVPIFTPGHRLAAHQDAERRGFAGAATVIDPTAVVARSATVGAGSYVNVLAVVGAATRLGAFVFVNRAVNIGHHAEIGDFAALGPGAVVCGNTRLGRGSVVAAGAVVLPGVEIGSNSVIAAGAVVRDSVGEHCLVAGNPACVVKTDYAGFRNLSV